MATQAFSSSFPCQYTWGMGEDLADRGRMATTSYRYATTEASMLLRLTSSSEDSLRVLPAVFLNPNTANLPPRPAAEGIHAKKHILRSKEERQLTADDCSSPEVKGSLCCSHPREGHTHTARALGHFILLCAIAIKISIFSRQQNEPFLLWLALHYHRNSS